MENQTVKDGKLMAIVSYFHFIGLIIAFILNQNKKNYFVSFHLRQSIGLVLLSFVVNILRHYANLDFIGNMLALGLFVLWIIALVGAIKGEEKRIPLLGDQFQEWFKNFG